MYYVYILISKKFADHHYVGITSDINRGVQEHNNPSYKSYTTRYAPWKLETYITFSNKILAEQLEIYLKSHSGKAFLKKHLI